MFKFFLYLFSLTFVALCSQAQTPGFKNEFGFRTENDAYLGYGQDRYYTNGLFINFRHAADQSKLKENVYKKIWELEAGQMIFNPYSGYVDNVARIDRPFAGYLYGSGSINWFYSSESSLKVVLELGTIGPSSLAEAGQVLLHNTIGFYEIKGWETQVRDELGINARVNYNNLLARGPSEKVDLSLTSDANIGSTFLGAGAGLLFRWGSLNPLHNSAITSSNLSNNGANESVDKKEIFFFAKPAINFIAYDATSQGGLFRSNKGPITFDVKPIVFSQQLGVMYSQKRWTADFSLIFKSREIKSMAKAHQYGSAALYYRFN